MVALSSSFIAPKEGGFEPFRAYDWLITILGVGSAGGVTDGPATASGSSNSLALHAESAFMPTVSFDEIELGFGNDYVYVPGKARVEPGTVVYRDFVDPHTAQLLAEWWGDHYNPLTGVQHFATNYKKCGIIQKFSPGDAGNTSSFEWELRGIFLQNCTFGATLDYNASEVIKIEATIRFDRAIPNFASNIS